MTSPIIGKLKQMDAKNLATLEQNVRRVLKDGTEAKKAEAAIVLTAIDEERIRRAQEERERRQLANDAVRDKVKDLGLFDRVALAFEVKPPADWEVEVPRAIAEHPRRGARVALRTML